jgi:2-polyprenyl-6-methoxyphenol hydroxylase-like FAD-dependent oxidoreductase
VLWRGAVTQQNLPPWLTAMLESAWVTVVFSGGHAVFYLIPSSSCAGLLTWGVYTRPQQPDHLGIGELWETVERFLPPAWADVCRPSEIISVHPVTDLTADTYVAHPFVLIGDAATLARPHTGAGAVKAMLDAACLERSLIAGADWNEVLARYDAERRPEGNRLVDIGRRIGRAMVERTPEWASMTPADMLSWTAALLGGRDHYLYRARTQEMTG